MRKLRAALVCVFGALVLAPGAHAAVVAIQDDQISNVSSPAAVDTRVNLLSGTGAQWTRVDIDWSLVALAEPATPTDPADPAYDWRRYDLIFLGMRAKHVGVMVTVTGTPRWATPSGAWNATPPATSGSAFIEAVARRYNGTFTRPDGVQLPAIRSISPRNEPNIDLMTSPQCRRTKGRWTPVSPIAYAALLKASYARVKAVAPNMLVVAGDTAGGTGVCKNAGSTVGTFLFLKELHRNLGGGRRMPWDVWAQHMHPVGPPDRAAFFPSWPTLPKVITQLNAMHPRGRMPIIVSETSFATSYSTYHRYFVTESQQAKWIRLTYSLAKRFPQVEVVVYFNLQDHLAWPAGLYRRDGSAKPAAAAFRSIATTTPFPPNWIPPQ